MQLVLTHANSPMKKSELIIMPDDILEYWSSLSRELAARFNAEEVETSSAWWSWDNFKDDIPHGQKWSECTD